MEVEQNVKLETALTFDTSSVSPSLFEKESRPALLDNSLRLTAMMVARALGLLVGFLTVWHVIAMYLEDNLPGQSKFRRVVVQYFHFGNEANFPTFFSALLLLISSVICFCIYKLDVLGTNKQNARYWLTLSLILLFLSADEAVQIHEQLMSVTHYLIPNLSSILSSAWVVPYALIALVVGFYFVRFVFRLPAKTKTLILVAGFTFLVGALALEVMETYLHTEYGVTHILFTLNILVQELLEMTGMVVFIYALLDYLGSRHKGLVLSFK